MKRTNKIFSILENMLVSYVGGTLVFAITGLIFVNVATRYILQHGIENMQEWLSLFMVPLVFLGLAYGWRIKGTFVAAEFMLIRLKGKYRLIADLSIQICTLLFFSLILLWGTSIAAIRAYEVNDFVGVDWNPVITWPFKASMVLGSLLLAVRIIMQIIRLWGGDIIEEEAP